MDSLSRLASLSLARLIGRLARLPPRTHAVSVAHSVPISMRDGVVLLAAHYTPVGLERAPLVLVRSPYGREGLFGVLTGALFAERGYQSLVVSVRGTFGSGGAFFPFQQEKEDGADVVAWMRAQPFYPGRFASFGPSYLGLTQWAIAGDTPDLVALSAHVTASEFRNQSYAGDAFCLENALSWSNLITTQEQSLPRQIARGLFDDRLEQAYMHLPLVEADVVALGRPVEFYRAWLRHDAPGDPWWHDAMHDESLARVHAAVQMTTGWFDLFLPWQLADYAKLKAHGRAPRLTIGPWTHAQPPSMGHALRDAFALFGHVLRDEPEPTRAPVRVFVGGSEEWREIASFPPPSTMQRWHLQADRGFARTTPSEASPDRYRYDPADPTPSVGGPTLSGKTSGVRDNRSLEGRADVLVYTSEPLVDEVEIVGTIDVELFVRSSVAHTDFFVRVCDVDRRGRSRNVCDALQRVRPGVGEVVNATLRIRFALWPTAHRFRRGHRLRVQVASGAHPRYARNLGGGEPLATGTRLRVADQSIFHDPKRPSALLLPVTSA